MFYVDGPQKRYVVLQFKFQQAWKSNIAILFL